MSQSSSDRSDSLAVGPLLVWLLLQLLALVLAAARVSLAAAYPQPAEFQAVRLMLVAQFGGSSLLFPLLLKTWRTSIAAACTAGVMLCLAAALAAWPLAKIAPPVGLVVLWILLLATARALLPARGSLLALAAVATYVIGGPLVWYLRADFGSGTLVERSWTCGPLCGVLIAPASIPIPIGWGIVGIELVLLFTLLANRGRKARAA